jgi:hypothetical protein
MIRKLTLWTSSLVVISLVACGATRITTNLTTGEGGYIVVSLGATKLTKAKTHYLSIRQLATKSELQMGVQFHGLPFTKQTVDFEVNQDAAGQVLTRRLPPGEYELTGFVIVSDLANKTVVSGSKNELGIRFRVESEKVTYLGRYLSHTTSVFDASKQFESVYYMVVTDEQLQDIAIAKRKNDIPTEIAISKQVVDSSRLKHTLIHSQPLSSSAILRGMGL